MPTSEALIPTTIPTVTSEQLTLIKQTIAKGATDAELQLFLYDNARRGIHPLDRLIHFSKRAGKYTPITSIDYMRSRAAQTGDYAGSEDALFNGTPKSELWSATVTVWRLVHEQPCRFTATARWAEYKPADDFMYQKMPHTMLAKCAEALALRKGFPQELHGLYAAEEMAQAVDLSDLPEIPDDPAFHPPASPPPPAVIAPAPGPSIEARADREADAIPDARVLRVTNVKVAKTGKSAKGPWTLHVVTLSDGREPRTFSATVFAKAVMLKQSGALIDEPEMNDDGTIKALYELGEAPF